MGEEDEVATRLVLICRARALHFSTPAQVVLVALSR